MIILDTNVVSEVGRPEPDSHVQAWLDAQYDDVYITAVTLAELTYGVAAAPVGRARAALSDQLARTVTSDFSERILPFDTAAAVEFGHLMAARRRRGRPVGVADAQIAAIAFVHDAVVATRDVEDFEHPGLVIIDPWKA
jgi:predicted nucleic acid-binding protein